MSRWRVKQAGRASNGRGPEDWDVVHELWDDETHRRIARFYGEDGRQIAVDVCAILNLPEVVR